VPKVQKLVTDARAKGSTLIFSLGPTGKPEDFVPGLAPAAGEGLVQSGPDKFVATELEKILKDKGITTVIAVGTAAHGAVLYTASGAALRGLQVVVPVDGMSADPYAEQVTAWMLANAPVVSRNVTLTRIDMIGF
jgi:nicotinamidase-related amidase